jgi:hypothetical protein
MEQSRSSETDPPEIRRRLESIQRQRALIEDLATRLKAAQLEHDRMETELNEYRCSIAPIRKCPEEVLLMIFESFAEAAPELVMDLLQVCQRWRDIAANAPRLWTHINIKVEPTWDQRKAARKDDAMIETHIEHSASLPLHINVDLSDMLGEDAQVEGFYGGLLSNGCNNEICCDAKRYVSKLEECESNPIPFFSESYGPEKVSWTIRTLAGSYEEHPHTLRWQSARIFLPCNGRDITGIWKLFSDPTPQLKELLISADFSQLSSKKCFPDLSSLEALTLEGMVTDFDFLGLTFPSVKHLELEMDISLSSQLSLFTSLEYLDVLFQGKPAAGNVPAIHLPVLRDLTIHVYGSTGVEWHVPVLQTLMIAGSLDDESKALPNVHAVKVSWELRQPGNPTGVEPELHRTLQTILSKYSDMQELSLHIQLKPVWEKYVRDLSEEERLVLPPVNFYGR